MDILIIGGTGYVGSEMLKEALMRKHNVTALLRDPAKLHALERRHDNLRLVMGDILDTRQLSELAEQHDAVIVAFSTGGDPETLRARYHDAVESVIEAARASGTRILFVGGAGSLFLPDGSQLVDSPDFPEAWKVIGDATRKALDNFQSARDINWTVISPAPNLVQGERTGKFQLGGNEVPFSNGAFATISTADLAVALLNETEKPRFRNQRFSAFY